MSRYYVGNFLLNGVKFNYYQYTLKRHRVKMNRTSDVCICIRTYWEPEMQNLILVINQGYFGESYNCAHKSDPDCPFKMASLIQTIPTTRWPNTKNTVLIIGKLNGGTCQYHFDEHGH